MKGIIYMKNIALAILLGAMIIVAGGCTTAVDTSLAATTPSETTTQAPLLGSANANPPTETTAKTPLLGLPAPSPETPTILPAQPQSYVFICENLGDDKDDYSDTLEMKLGGTLDVSLCMSTGVPEMWNENPVIANPAVLLQQSYDMVPVSPSDEPGYVPTEWNQNWSFKAVATGNTTVKFVYSGSDSDFSTKTVTLTVTVE